MHSDHGSHDSGGAHIIDEKSIQDKILAALSAMVMVGLLVLGCYWQSLSLPAVEAEAESHEK
jgi:hypothetical protein